MINFVREKLQVLNSIRGRTIILFFLISAIPLLATRLVGFPRIKQAIQKVVVRDLESVGHKQAEFISVWMKERKADVKTMAKEYLVNSFLKFSPDDKEFKGLTSQLQFIRDNLGYKEVFLADGRGKIRVSTREDLIGLSIAESDYFQEALKGNVFVSRIHPSAFPIQNESGEMERGVPTLFVSGPIREDENGITGVVSLMVDVIAFSKEMCRIKLGETGETYLVDENGYMITESRFASTLREAGLIKRRTALELRLVDPTTGQFTKGVQACLKGESGYDAEGYPDYRGVRVLGFWYWIPEYHWGLMSEIDEEEAYSNLYELDRALMFVALVLIVVIVALAVFLGRRVTAPILYLTKVARRMSDGDLHQRVVVSSRDEIGHLAESFNTMAETIENNLKEIESSRNLLNDVLGNIGCMVRLVNPSTHKVILQNKSLHAFFPDGLERPCYAFWGRETECEPCISHKAVEERKPCFKEEEMPGGILYEVYSFPMANPDGSMTNAIEVIRDITAKRKMEGELEESRELLVESHKKAMVTVGYLSNGIAHHLNNPLSGIDMCADVLLKKIEDVKEADLYGELKEQISRIKMATGRCETAMEGLLNISRISNPDRLPVSVNDLIEHVLKKVSDQLALTGIKLTKDLPPTDIGVLGNPSQLRMVFMDILSNAVDSMRNGGTLTVKTEHLASEGRVLVTIADTGHGINKEDLSHLFDPYFILKVRPHGRCTGLELALAQLTIQSHTGTIEADSEVGGGTTLSIRLPVHREPLTA